MRKLTSYCCLATTFPSFFLFSCHQIDQVEFDPMIESQHSEIRSDIQDELEDKLGLPQSAVYHGFDAGEGNIDNNHVYRLWQLF